MIRLRIGRSIHAVKDEHDRNFFYTDMFVARHRANIRGAFSAVMRFADYSLFCALFVLCIMFQVYHYQAIVK